MPILLTSEFVKDDRLLAQLELEEIDINLNINYAHTYFYMHVIYLQIGF